MVNTQELLKRAQLIDLVIKFASASNEFERAKAKRDIELMRAAGIDFATKEMQVQWAKWSRL